VKISLRVGFIRKFTETVHKKALCYTVARFFNRQDADDHRRFLNRYMPAAEFEVIFDVPNSQLNDDSGTNDVARIEA
jgi:hypothetical protein